jgi:hypothetical protein
LRRKQNRAVGAGKRDKLPFRLYIHPASAAGANERHHMEALPFFILPVSIPQKPVQRFFGFAL